MLKAYTKYLLVFLILTMYSSYSSDWKHIKQLNTGHCVNIDCWDSLNCYCLIQQSGSAELYLSSDGGINWLMQYITDYSNPQTLGMLNARLCVSPNPNYFYIPTDEDKLIKSTDGGKNFKTITLSDNSSITNLVMKDSIIGISITSLPTQVFIHTTNDGWETSRKLDSNIFATVVMEEILENNKVPMRMSQVNLERTFFIARFGLLDFNFLNFEENYVFFIDSSEGYRDNFRDMSIINDSVYFATGSRGMYGSSYRYDLIFKTTDSGSSWVKQLDSLYEPTFGLQKIAFYDAMNGVAVGYFKIAMTNNGGETWLYDELPQRMIDNDPLTLQITWSGKTPMLGSWDGDIYRYEGNFFKFLPEPMPVSTIHPENNSTKINNSDLEFKWNLKEGYNKYYFQLSESPNFKNLQNEERIENQSITIDSLNDFTEYYWRVAFKFDKKYIWSAPAKFRTQMASTYTTAPVCGETEQEFKVNFAWVSVKGVEYYKFRISTDPNFVDNSDEYKGITDTTFEVPDLEELTTYYWQVQPYRTDEEGTWSNVCNFRTKKSTSVRYSEGRGIRIRPNPAGDFITISLSDLSPTLKHEVDGAAVKVQIFDVLGIEVAQTPSSVFGGQTGASDLLRIDVSKLPAGVYFIRFSCNNGACSIVTKVEKFVKI